MHDYYYYHWAQPVSVQHYQLMKRGDYSFDERTINTSLSCKRNFASKRIFKLTCKINEIQIKRMIIQHKTCSYVITFF